MKAIPGFFEILIMEEMKGRVGMVLLIHESFPKGGLNR